MIVPDAGNFPHLERPGEVNRLILDRVARWPGEPASGIAGVWALVLVTLPRPEIAASAEVLGRIVRGQVPVFGEGRCSTHG